MLPRQSRPGCFGLLFTWLLAGAAVWLTAELVPGVAVSSFGVAMWAAVVLGLLNALVRPVLVVLTLPVTIVTLGLFLLVVNGAMVGLAAWFLDGFTVSGLFPAVLASLVLTVVSAGMNWVLEGGRRRQEG